MNKLRTWFNSSNLIALLAVFVAMAGTAVAVTKAPKNSVTSPSIRNGAVTGKDVKDNTLTGIDIDENSLDVAGTRGAPGPEGPAGPKGATGPAGPLGAAGGDLTGSYPDPQIAAGAIGTAQIADGSLYGADVIEARQGGIGRYAYQGGCDPDGLEFVPCADTTVTLHRPGRLLITGTVEGLVEGDKEYGLGNCRLWSTGGTVHASTTAVSDSDAYGSEHAALTAVTSVLGTGSTTVGLECNQRPAPGGGLIEFPQARLAVVALSGD